MEYKRVEVVRSSCLAASALAGLPDQSIDVSIFDAPYSAHVHTSARTNAKGAQGGVLAIDFAPLKAKTRTLVARHLARLTKRWVLAFCEEEGAHLWREAGEEAGLEYIRTGRWVKDNPMPQKTGDRPAQGDEAIVILHQPGKKRWNGGGRTAVYHAGYLDSVDGRRLHKTQKPVALMEALVRDFTERGELVLDPFCGVGSTGVAALKHGRRFLGYERDRKYHHLACERLCLVREQLSLFPEPTAVESDEPAGLVSDIELDPASLAEADLTTKEQGHGM